MTRLSLIWHALSLNSFDDSADFNLVYSYSWNLLCSRIWKSPSRTNIRYVSRREEAVFVLTTRMGLPVFRSYLRSSSRPRRALRAPGSRTSWGRRPLARSCFPPSPDPSWSHSSPLQWQYQTSSLEKATWSIYQELGTCRTLDIRYLQYKTNKIKADQGFALKRPNERIWMMP